jgi:hypothetical protein
MPKNRPSFIDSVINNFDRFGEEPPQFNLKQRTRHGTFIGFTCSLAVFILVLLYSIIKISAIKEGRAKQVNIHTQVDQHLT